MKKKWVEFFGQAPAGFFLYGAIFAFIGALFTLKYGTRLHIFAVAAALIYPVFLALQIPVLAWMALRIEKTSRPRLILIALLTAYLGAALAIYLRMDPYALKVDRWSSLDRVWTAIFHGVFPYPVASHLGHPISGFPVMFLLALPFYGLGDVGYMQFAALIGFVLLALLKFHETGRPVFLAGILIGLPVFEYEVFVRSDLFANMVAVAWLIHWSSPLERSQGAKLFFWAAAWGLLLATRGIVLIPLILMTFHLLQNRGFKDWIGFGCVLSAVFFTTFLPFYLWNAILFWEHNPYNVQSGYIPTWALVMVLLIACFLGYRHRRNSRLYFHSGILLFSTVLLCLILKCLTFGWVDALWGSQFDNSYFSLCTPFLLLSMGESLPAAGTGGLKK